MYKDDQSFLVEVPLTVIEPVVADIVDPKTWMEWSPTGPAVIEIEPVPRALSVAFSRYVRPTVLMLMFPLLPAEVSRMP